MYHKIKQLLTAQEQRQMLVLILLVVVGTCLETIGLGLVVPAVATMTQPHLLQRYVGQESLFSAWSYLSQTQLIMMGMATLVVMYIIKTVFLIFMTWKQNKFTYNVQASLSHRLFLGYMRQSWAFHLQRNSAQLILNVTNEVSMFTSSAIQPGIILFTEGFVLMGVSTLLLVVEPVGAFIVLSVLGVTAWVFQRLVRNVVFRWGKIRQHHELFKIKHLQQGLGGVKDAKLLGREWYFIGQYKEHNIGCANVIYKYRTVTEMPRLWLEVLAVIGLAGLVFTMLFQNKSIETVIPTLSLFAAAAFRLMPSVNRLLGAAQNLRYSLPIVNTLHDEFSLVGECGDLNKEKVFCFEKKIVLQQVTYGYINTDSVALNEISLTIHRGTSIGFIGSSGSGKSTLVDIILGLLTPDNGLVKVDDIDIQYNLRSWQDQVGYVPQTIYLTDDTLRRNVAFGLADDLIDEMAIQRAIQAAQLQDFISTLPEGLDTLVGERGVRLSGGQRQRIGIARALYHDPAVLVLDEATSALDTVTEQEVMEAVNALHGTKTIIIVAHRLSTVAGCDWLYRIEQGKVIEAGTFHEIINNNNVPEPA